MAGLVIVLVVVATSIWVLVDARKIPGAPAAEWALGSLLLWVVVFPLYLWQRRKYIAAVSLPQPRQGPPAGWYDDPTESGRLRWWDGSSWGPQAP